MNALLRNFAADLESDSPAAITFRFERYRAVALGISETASTTFLMLIAVRWFEAGATAKALLACANSAGFLLAPFVVSVVERKQLPTARAAAWLSYLGAICFLLMAALPTLPVFVVGSLLGIATISAAIPLQTQLYQDNYPASIRGRLFSRTTMIRIVAGGFFGFVAGHLLDGQLKYFQLLLIAFAFALALSGWCLAQCPSKTLHRASGRVLFRGFVFLRSDPVFRNTLIFWMIMGFGNLMMVPLRVEYLANPRYGLALSEMQIAVLVSVIPSIARLLLSPVWGMLFDRMNFFWLRVAVNCGFMIGVLTFFTSETSFGLALGAVFYGIGNAGGEIAWGLWVTKFAPSDRVADYMSVHTFFTGIRGIIAPLVSFHLATVLPITTMGMISAGMIFLSSVLMLLESRNSRANRLAGRAIDHIG